ncbi:MAG TPA: sugar transferase [Acidobacteriaceae bacterium]|jgi:exopolysaccharide biosynthesis polyprenyl glycosylphosphotransferase|nr:sugar transferase [Acidobacteriaceae bacterium]
MSSPEFVPRLHAAERFHFGGSRTVDRVRSSFWSQPARVAVFWALCDIFCVLVATAAAIRIYLGNFTSDASVFETQSMLSASPWLSLFYLCWFILSLILVSRRMHLYAPIQLRNTLHDQRLTIQACFTAGLLLSGALYLGRGQEISRGVVILTIAFTAMLLTTRRLIWRAIVYRRYDRGIETRNILVVGTGRVGQALRHHIDSIRHLGFSFKGFVRAPGYESEGAASADVLGTIDEVLGLARKHFVDEIFLTAPCERMVVKRLVQQAREAGVDVRVVPDLYDGLAWNAPIEYIGQFPTIPLHRGEVPMVRKVLKRMLDIAVSSVALVLLSPVLLALAIAVRVDSQGPIFYKSDRMGKKARVFRCLKFRTMVPDAEKRKADVLHMNERDTVLFKITNDPRITRVGRFLRKYSLDELPQLFNVLRGDMSLVGPRPPIASEVKRYELNHLRRLDVLPGITGLWQVQARQDPSFDSYISLDTAYIENWSLWLDAKILVRTIGVVISGTGT